MRIFFTKEKYWLDKWDEFVYSNTKGNHLIFSDWLKSYQSYGFDFEVGICVKNEQIIGGFGAVIAKKFFFKFYIIPHGPIFLDGFEGNIKLLINESLKHVKKIKCCYLQYSLPFSENNKIKRYTYKLEVKNRIGNAGKSGNLFKYIYSSYGINWISFDGINSPDELLRKFTIQVRRNINLAYRNNIKIKYLQNEDDCKLAYSLIQRNATLGNYSVRRFEDFKHTMLNLIHRKRAFMIAVIIDNDIKGAAFIVDCGSYLSYISGGTKKEKQNSNIGYIIHWEAIKKSYELDYKGYNISMGGSEGVQEFKAKFMAEAILFDEPHRYFILKPAVFKIYYFLNKYIRKNKERIANIIKIK